MGRTVASVHFEYKISRDEYVAAQRLYYRLHGDAKRRRPVAAIWILIGMVFAIMALNSRPPSWAPYDFSAGLPLFFLAVIGIWWIYGGLQAFFPARYFRRAYRSFELGDKIFKADVDETGFRVAGEFLEWRAQWAGVKFKAENDKVFVFLAGNTLFIFGKTFLTGDQQADLRTLSGIKPA